MGVWQLFAGAVAILLAIAWVVPVARHRLWGVVVVSSLSLVVPAVGFAAYALDPGPLPVDDAVVFLVALLYVAAFVSLIWRLTIGRKRRRELVYPSAIETRRYARGFITRALLVVWLSGLLFLFEPWFAVANLAINAGWTAMWVPRRWRRKRFGSGVDISVPPERVFEFVTDLKNWPLYREDVEIVSVTPDGPLAVGTEYVARTAIPPSMQTTSHRQIETRHRVTALIPGRSYTTTFADQSGTRFQTDFVPANGGTRMTQVASVTLPFPQASLGMTLNFGKARSVVQAQDARRYARLKEILEGAQSQ